MTEQQLFQTQNILETLIEATDHFAALIKQKELNQSIYVFSSIVEGSQAIIHILHKQDEKFINQTKKLKEYLIYISNELEQGHLIKVSEIIQFSLRPLFVRLKESFIKDVGDQKSDEKVSIGIFHSWANPKDFISKDRLEATLHEAEKQDTALYFFTSTDIDFEKEQIHADTFCNDQWDRITVAFPDVINNIGAGKGSQVERRLQRFVPFTGFHVGNKFTLPKRLLKHRKFAELLVPFTVCTSEENVYEFINKNNQVVFKALGSNRGENIYFVTKRGSRYIMLDQTKERILNEQDFKNFVKHTILAEMGSYIIQRYIHTRTKADEPYHFRSHVQKNHHGKWEITHIYPRIGSKNSNLSNISTEGRVEEFPTFLREQYGEKQGLIYEEEILKLSIDVTKQLDKLYGMTLNELGLDFAIDDTGRIWMHEANNGPQTAYHEEKRAVNFIAYAKYIAKNGMMHTSYASKEAFRKGQFQARQTDLPLAEQNEESSIGMLVGRNVNDDLSRSLANTTNDHHISFYRFTPEDIDYDLGLIRASFYENDQWIQRVAEFPDVIIDRLKSRSLIEPKTIYEELEEIPFSNEWVIDATSRSTIYKLLQKGKEIGNYTSSYQSVNRPLHVFQFLEKYRQVGLKQKDMAYSNPFYTIRVLDDKQYEVLVGSTRKVYSENQLRNYINHLIKDNQYIVQEYSANSDTLPEVHVLVMKNRVGEWSVVTKHIELKSIESDATTMIIKQTLDEFLSYSTDVDTFVENVDSLAINIASFLDGELNNALSEIALAFAVEKNNKLQLIEANPNGPRTVGDADLYAQALIEYAMGIVNKSFPPLI